MKSIVIIGFMGTGKTETAKILAQRLGLDYVSMDDEIEKRAGMKISEIFVQKGETAFRQMEAELARELGTQEGLVIDAGGGVVINQENVKNLKQNGTIFCLTATADKIYERTSKFNHRPLLNVSDPLGAIKELMQKRAKFYESAADHEIDGTNLTVTQTAEKILEILKK